MEIVYSNKWTKYGFVVLTQAEYQSLQNSITNWVEYRGSIPEYVGVLSGVNRNWKRYSLAVEMQYGCGYVLGTDTGFRCLANTLEQMLESPIKSRLQDLNILFTAIMNLRNLMYTRTPTPSSLYEPILETLFKQILRPGRKLTDEEERRIKQVVESIAVARNLKTEIIQKALRMEVVSGSAS